MPPARPFAPLPAMRRAGALAAVPRLALLARCAGALLVFPRRNLILLNEIAILALFALSLDLILGYAGIVSLGHAAFFGLGAYAAGLLSKHGFGDRCRGWRSPAAAGQARSASTRGLPAAARHRSDPPDGDARHRAAALRARQPHARG